jgi:DNA primase
MPWKLLGTKEKWVYPAFLNYQKIREDRMVILVESIGDCLALFNAGIENVLVTFGIALTSGILNFLIRSDVKCIVIGFNNDKTKGEEWGNKAASRVSGKLRHYFDEHQIEIALPDKKDFGEMSKEEILLWKNQRLCQPVASKQ